MYLFQSVFLFFGFFWDIYPGVKLLGHMVVLFLVFREITILSSIVTAPLYIPTNRVQGFSFLHVLTNVYFFVFSLMTAILTGVR